MIIKIIYNKLKYKSNYSKSLLDKESEVNIGYIAILQKVLITALKTYLISIQIYIKNQLQLNNDNYILPIPSNHLLSSIPIDDLEKDCLINLLSQNNNKLILLFSGLEIDLNFIN